MRPSRMRNDGIDHSGRFQAVRGHQDGGLLLVADAPQQVREWKLPVAVSRLPVGSSASRMRGA